MQESLAEYKRTLALPDLQDCPFLIWCNKSDQKGCLSAAKIREIFLGGDLMKEELEAVKKESANQSSYLSRLPSDLLGECLSYLRPKSA